MGRKLGMFDRKATPFFACQKDQRFSYCLYIPSNYQEEGDDRRPLVVVLHGTARTAAPYRDNWIPFAEETGAVILSPLFPAHIIDPEDTDNYKLIRYHDIRYDHVFLSMVDEVAATYRVHADRFLLHGFSGGGQFANRFFFLHPHRLQAVSIGAPGMVTLLDESRDWWVGVRNIQEQFGTALDLAAMRRAQVQMVVGADDTQTSEITIQPDWSYWWMEGANSAGVTRIDRLQALRRSFETHGIAVRFDLVPGIGHAGMPVQDTVRDFFRKVLVGRSNA